MNLTIELHKIYQTIKSKINATSVDEHNSVLKHSLNLIKGHLCKIDKNYQNECCPVKYFSDLISIFHSLNCHFEKRVKVNSDTQFYRKTFINEGHAVAKCTSCSKEHIQCFEFMTHTFKIPALNPNVPLNPITFIQEYYINCTTKKTQFSCCGLDQISQGSVNFTDFADVQIIILDREFETNAISKARVKLPLFIRCLCSQCQLLAPIHQYNLISIIVQSNESDYFCVIRDDLMRNCGDSKCGMHNCCGYQEKRVENNIDKKLEFLKISDSITSVLDVNIYDGGADEYAKMLIYQRIPIGNINYICT